MSLTISVNPVDICWLVRLSQLGEGIYAKVIEQQDADGMWRNQLFHIQPIPRLRRWRTF